MCCKDAESIWKAPEQAEAIRRKVQELTKSKMPPPLTLETSNEPAVSVVSLETKQVLCSAASTAELLTILSAASTSATQAPPTNGHVKLPKGHLAVVAGCNGDIWEVAIQAGRLREKIKELSGMTSLPPLVMDREKNDVSIVKMGKVKVPPRKRRVSVTFESRPFGMTPAKDEGGGTLGYVVDKVNHNDPSKPAARLGVKPGWVVVFVAGEDVQGRSLDDVQQLTKQAALPVTIDFEVPVVVKEKQEASDKNRSKSAPQQPRPPPQPTRESRERTETQRLQALLRTLDSEEKLPATVFIFSRRRVEALAAEMPNLDVCTNEERSKVHLFLKKAFERLSEADKMLPQVCKVEELARRGVGIHHGGMLPVVKEAVEIMFSRGLVKILLATETFAMGVNMPARSVIFTAWMKHDGNQRRPLLPSEYTQMAGRAGRRGLDTEGHVYILCGDEPPDTKQIMRMMTSKGEPLFSRFRVTFAMILQMKRFSQSGVQVEDLLGKSFLENARARRRPRAHQDRRHRNEQLQALPTLECIYGEPDMEDYAYRELESHKVGVEIHARLFSKSRERVFCPGCQT
ncbi:unnamed protein product [Cladocopium goreaui]|uniref:DExH-box ATP-dependent RNA helicase DExH11 (AtHELPS) (Protein SKI2 homolog) (AtSKI2) n=1 Tax=Cladocopium goreaui TaxID=2562237 RepID=A0A9P1D8F4_9DINO|nr:unnamed protein product [Cladocopium goreaui]